MHAKKGTLSIALLVLHEGVWRSTQDIMLLGVMGLYCGYNALELTSANYLQINEITPKSSHFLATFPNLG